MNKFIIYYNYLVDMYPWRSIIIIISIVLIACLALYYSLFIIGSLLYLLFMIMTTIRSFYNSHKIDGFYGQWFLHRDNYFFMFKKYKYDQLIIYNYNFNNRYKYMGLAENKYDIYSDSKYGIDLSYTRLANRKEIKKHELNILEAKILLLSENERI